MAEDYHDSEVLDYDEPDFEEAEEVEGEDAPEEASEAESAKSDKVKAEKAEEEEPKTLDDLLDEDSMGKKVKIKVNGQEKVMTVREAIKVKQLEEASRENMKQSAEDRKMMKQLASMAKQNPGKFMELVGVDPFEFAQATVAERIEMASLPKEQREAMQLKEENERLRKEHETYQEQQQRMVHEQQVQQEYETFETQITEAWQESKLPDQPVFRSSIAQAMLADRRAKVQEAIDMGQDPRSIPAASFLTPAQAAEIVRENWLDSVRGTFNQMDAEAILEILDKDTIKAIQRASIKRVSDRTSPKYSKGPGRRPASIKPKQKDGKTEDDYAAWQERLNQLAQG